MKEVDVGTFPTEMLRELISPTEESTRVKRVGDPLNEQDNETTPCLTQNTFSITDPTPQSLSCLSQIFIYHIERQEMKMLADFLPLFTGLQWIDITGKPFEIIDAQLTETLVSRIIFNDSLHKLDLSNINLTAKPAAVIARSLHQAPGLRYLDLSENPLGEGVSVLTRHLSRVPHLNALNLSYVKLTKQQVNDLSEAVRQSNISSLQTLYHVSFVILVCICSHCSCPFCSIYCGVVLRILEQLQNTPQLIYMSLNKNSVYCVMPRSSKPPDTCK